VAFYRRHQCGFRSIRMRKEDMSDAICHIQLLSRREDHIDIRSSASPNSVREFLWEGTQKCTPKVDGFPKATHERIFAHEELRLTAGCSPHCRNPILRPQQRRSRASRIIYGPGIRCRLSLSMEVMCEERRGTWSNAPLLLNNQRMTLRVVEGCGIEAGALAFLAA